MEDHWYLFLVGIVIGVGLVAAKIAAVQEWVEIDELATEKLR